MMKNYPTHAYKSKKLWLRNVRKRWVLFRRYWRNTGNWDESIWCGCLYYPKEVYEWLNQFEKMDKLMREHYKNA